MDQPDAEKILFSQTSGELVFAVLNEDSNVNPGPGTNADEPVPVI